MQWPHPPPHDEPDFGDDEARKQRTNIIVLAIATALVILSVLLLVWLKDRAALQGCIAASHRNCLPIGLPDR